MMTVLRYLVALSVCLILLSITAIAQEDDVYTDESFYGLPDVAINSHAVSLQASLYPEYYRTHSARSDLRWVQRNDSALTAFWEENRTLILQFLSQNSGIPWVESEFDIYLIRYYHTAGEGNPVILPLGGIRTGDLIEAPPSGARLQFGLIFQMAKRMLAQSYRPDDGVHLSIADHPLMRHGPYRRDNLAMLLAMVTAEQVIGLDSTFDAYQSAYWKKRHAGREIFEQYLLKEWILTPERPLATWIAEEPYGSRLVAMTRPPRRSRTDETSGRQYVEGLPTKGRLGFSVRTDGRGRLVVDKIDVGRLAYASGLMEGDVIRQVDGRRVSSHRELIARILEGLQGLGATLSIQREGQPMTVVIQPLELSPYDEEYFWDDPEDFLYEPPKVPDSLLPRDTLQSEFDQQ